MPRKESVKAPDEKPDDAYELRCTSCDLAEPFHRSLPRGRCPECRRNLTLMPKAKT